MEVVDTGANDDDAGRARRRSAASSTCSASRSTAARAVTAEDYYPIHREAPEYEDLESKTEIFETGIKVVDLLEPYIQGGKTGLFGGAGVGKTVIIMELINNLAHGARRHVRVHRRGRAHP